MYNAPKTPAELALEALELAYAYYDQQAAPKQPEPQEYFEYLAAA